MFFSRFSGKAIYFALSTTILIFILDFIIPPGTAIGALYLASITIIYRQTSKVIFSFATLTTVLIILNVIIFRHKIPDASIYADRIISIVAIWCSTLVAIRYRKLNMIHEAFREKKLKEIEEMLYITNHKVRHPISEIIGLSDLIKDHEDQQEIDYMKFANNIKKPALELDNFTRELSEFLNEIEHREPSLEVKEFIDL